MNKEELREQLQNYSKPKLVEMCIKLLEEKERVCLIMLLHMMSYWKWNDK